jgi:hypothetical protein
MSQIGHNNPPPAHPRAIIRHNDFGRKGRYIVVLGPLGHVVESHKLDRNYGGSMLECELGWRHEGDRFDRLAAQCDGHGH